MLKSGECLHRIHQTTFDGNKFNPCQGRPTRFAPISDTKGACVPSLYAGSSLDAAIFETVFHDVSPKAPFKTVPLADVVTRSHSEVILRRDLVVIELRAPDLKKLGLAHGELVSAPASEYAATALWAKAFHGQFSDIDGLVWTSNQCDPESAYLMFGDRVLETDLHIQATRDAAVDPSLVVDIRKAGERAGIVITL